MEIIGRKEEQKIIRDAMDSNQSEFIAVYGRRRIGKTFLIKKFFHDKFDFYMTGIYDSTKKELLEYFNAQLEEYSGKEWPIVDTWMKAFRQLKNYLLSLKKDKVVVFIDELPWFDTHRSRFIRALEVFWNGWLDNDVKLKFIVCGSATTWMTNKLIGDRGGLHNRVTRQIYLAPFNLHDTEELLRSKGVTWDRKQIVECYMAMGGTPFYLSKIDKGMSLAQNIDKLFFRKTGELRHEYDFLFRSLFHDSSLYRQIVELLASKGEGLTRAEIKTMLNIQDGGNLSEALKNLISCDFIRAYESYGKKERDRLYQLTDLYILFYLKQVKGNESEDEDYWLSRIDLPSRRAWSGYAFEQVCLHHIPQIKKALGINGIATKTGSWTGFQNGKKVGQIDLVIDRRDDIVNLCEMKFSTQPFEITKEYMERIYERTALFKEMTKTNKAPFITFITMNGLTSNSQASLIHNVITADELFAPK